MTVHVEHDGNEVTLRARADGKGDVGDLFLPVREGQSAFGFTFEQWRQCPAGPIELPRDTLPASRGR
jgi:hypothetical protein